MLIHRRGIVECFFAIWFTAITVTLIDVIFGRSGIFFSIFISIFVFALIFNRIRLVDFFSYAAAVSFIPIIVAILQTSDSSTMLMVGLKEIGIFVIFTLLLIKSSLVIKINSLDVCILLFLSAWGVSFISSDFDIYVRLIGSKDALLIVILYFTGRFFDGTNINVSEISNRYVFISLFLIVTNLFIYMFDDIIWSIINITDYFRTRFSGAHFLVNLDDDLPPGFYTFFGGERYSRFVGSLLDAPGFSRFLVFFVALGICQRFKNLSFHGDKKFSTLIILLLLILTQFLTLGRAGILISISSLFVIITLQKRYRYFGLFGMIFLVLSLIPFASIDVGNFFRHLIGLQAGFSNMTMFGHGMGSGGQQIANYAAETASSIEVRESFLGAWVFQTGYYGFFTYITLVVCLVVYLFRLNINKIHQKSRAIYISSLLCVLFAFLSSIFANSAMSFYSLMLPLIFLGATVGCYKNVK